MAAPSTGRGLVRRVASASAAGAMAGIRDQEGDTFLQRALEGGNGALLFQRFHRGKRRLESFLFASFGRAEAAGPAPGVHQRLAARGSPALKRITAVSSSALARPWGR